MVSMAYEPEHSIPHIYLDEMVTPDKIIFTLRVNDFHNFIESLLEIKEGGRKTFKRQNHERRLELRIINSEHNIKELGG
jgi:hypothetical protein